MKFLAVIHDCTRRVARWFGGALDAFLTARPGLSGRVARYGMLAFVALAGLFVVAGAAIPEGRGQQIVYADSEGAIYAASPGDEDRTSVYAPDDGAWATAPLLNGGSRSLSFTVFRDGGEDFRGDLYGADLVRVTTALVQTADPGEAFVYGGYSYDRAWLMAERFSGEEPPNVAVLSASGATLRYIGPEEGGAGISGASWTAQNSLYAWLSGRGESRSLTAYDFFERRQAAVYRTERRTGRVSYDFDSNTAVFDERPAGSGLRQSRLVALTGTTVMDVSGTAGLGVYDPSLPVPDLDNGMAVLWTDGNETGVGVVDPARWTFEKTGVTVEPGSRYPGISYDGTYVATMRDDTITVRRMDDGSVVSRIEGVQSPEAAVERMREAGLDVPESVGWSVPPPYTWRSFAD